MVNLLPKAPIPLFPLIDFSVDKKGGFLLGDKGEGERDLSPVKESGGRLGIRWEEKVWEERLKKKGAEVGMKMALFTPQGSRRGN